MFMHIFYIELIPTYYVDYSKTINAHDYMNHYKCATKLEDFYMHDGSGGAFFPMYKESVQDLYDDFYPSYI